MSSAERDAAVRTLRAHTIADANGAAKRLRDGTAALMKEYGSDVFVDFITGAPNIDARCIHTGVQALDDLFSGQGDVTHNGCITIPNTGRGIPRGRITELSGPENGGKTTTALTIVAAAQALGLNAAYLDVEHSVDLPYARRIGVNLADLRFDQPDTGEGALDLAMDLIRKEFDIVAIDSVAALSPSDETDQNLKGGRREADDVGTPGEHARMMARNLRRMTTLMGERCRTAVLLINQIRFKIGGYGNPETTTGGSATKHYASIRADVRSIGKLGRSLGDARGQRTRVRCFKNKIAIPFREVFLEIGGGRGIIDAHYKLEAVKKKEADDDDDE